MEEVENHFPHFLGLLRKTFWLCNKHLADSLIFADETSIIAALVHFLLFALLPFSFFFLLLLLPCNILPVCARTWECVCLCALLGAVALTNCPPAQFQLNIIYERSFFYKLFFWVSALEWLIVLHEYYHISPS